MRRFKIVHLVTNYYPEGHQEYKKEYRANALYPGTRDNNNEEDEIM